MWRFRLRFARNIFPSCLKSVVHINNNNIDWDEKILLCNFAEQNISWYVLIFWYSVHFHLGVWMNLNWQWLHLISMAQDSKTALWCQRYNVNCIVSDMGRCTEVLDTDRKKEVLSIIIQQKRGPEHDWGFPALKWAPENYKRAPEKLSVLKFTPARTCSKYARRGARWEVGVRSPP